MKNLQPLVKLGIMMIQKLKEYRKIPLKRSFVIWISKTFGRSLRKRIFPRIEELLNVNGSSR
jgi:hypothetical protein